MTTQGNSWAVCPPTSDAMLRFGFLILAAAVLVGCSQKDTQTFIVTAADGVRIFGDYAAAPVPQAERRGTIILFHQGGANARGEYGPIMPALLEAGFDVVASDLRRGGQLYGSWNRTVAAYPQTDPYCSVAQDIDAVLDHVSAQDMPSPIILWGSSYSAALVIGAAGRHADLVSGVLAFSPASGDPMEGCRPNEHFDSMNVPLIVFRPAREAVIESVAAQLAAAESAGHAVVVAEPGTHGSSMLVPERVEGGLTEPTWNRVWEFLDRVAG